MELEFWGVHMNQSQILYPQVLYIWTVHMTGALWVQVDAELVVRGRSDKEPVFEYQRWAKTSVYPVDMEAGTVYLGFGSLNKNIGFKDCLLVLLHFVKYL